MPVLPANIFELIRLHSHCAFSFSVKDDLVLVTVTSDDRPSLHSVIPFRDLGKMPGEAYNYATLAEAHRMAKELRNPPPVART